MPNYRQELWQLDRTIAKVERALGRAEQERDKADERRIRAIEAHQSASAEVARTNELLAELKSTRAVLEEQHDDNAPEGEEERGRPDERL